jgi:subtilisin family serine protease
MRSLRVQFAARIGRQFRSGAEHWLLGPGHSVEEALRTLIGHPVVAYAEPNYRVFPVRAPGDPRYPELWGLNNTGQQGGTPGADSDAESAWDISTGDRRVRVAVIDTAIEFGHPDLEGQVWTNPGEIPNYYVDDDANGFVDDVNGWDFFDDDLPADYDSHGTHVAGTIGGLGNDGFGVAGVAWSVTIVPIKFLCYGWGSTADAIAAIEYATLLGVDVMNNSWGGGESSQAMLDAINAAAQQDILFVAAAGDDNKDNDIWPFYPASLDDPNIVAVAATDRSDGRAWFSSWGALSVDLGAPGVEILSAVMGGSHGLKNGTSVATPHVSAVAALMRAVAPEMGVVALKQHLLESVEPVSSMMGITVTEGRLNAYQALFSVDQTPPDPVTASAPQPAGSMERTEIGGLDPATPYYFALVSSDDSGNVSPLSNVASGTTLDPPTIAPSPASFSASLITGAVSNQIVTIENVGVGTLDWVIPPPDPRHRAAGADNRHLRRHDDRARTPTRRAAEQLHGVRPGVAAGRAAPGRRPSSRPQSTRRSEAAGGGGGRRGQRRSGSSTAPGTSGRDAPRTRPDSRTGSERHRPPRLAGPRHGGRRSPRCGRGRGTPAVERRARIRGLPAAAPRRTLVRGTPAHARRTSASRHGDRGVPRREPHRPRCVPWGQSARTHRRGTRGSPRVGTRLRPGLRGVSREPG